MLWECDGGPVLEVVSELAVVGDDDDGGWGGVEGLGEFVDERDGEVVGGFVEEQEVWSGGECECEVEASLLAHGQLGDGSCEIGGLEQAEGAQRHGLGLGQPVVEEFVEACSVDVACGSAVGRRGLLRDESDSGVGGETCVAVVGVEVAGEDGEQG